tara:strand:+ start:67 stop:306 length:240 start_codon:yes stop_codon:yes gene_type:complete
MLFYPFNESKKGFNMPAGGRSIITKEYLEDGNTREDVTIEFDLDVIKEYFPEAQDKEEQIAIVESIIPAIFRVHHKKIY